MGESETERDQVSVMYETTLQTGKRQKPEGWALDYKTLQLLSFFLP